DYGIRIRIVGNYETREINPRAKRRGIVDRGCERDRFVQRKIEKLLQSEVCDLAIASPLNQQWPLIVARDLRAQELELRDVPDVFRELRLLENILGLIERSLGNRDEAVCERRVVVRLRYVENDLRALSGKLDVGGFPAGICSGSLRRDPSTVENVLRQRETEVVLVHLTEGQTLERCKRI